MAEFEFAGMTFRGGKMMVIFTALSTLSGGMWAGFEFYKDYMDMKEIIQNIDIGAISARNDVIETKLNEAIDYTRDIKDDLRNDIIKIDLRVDYIDGVAKDLRTDVIDRLDKADQRMRDSLALSEAKLNNSEERIKNTQASIDDTLDSVRSEMNVLQKDVTASIREVEATVRESEKDVRNTMRSTEERIDENMRKLDQDLKKTIQESLDNPLAN